MIKHSDNGSQKPSFRHGSWERKANNYSKNYSIIRLIDELNLISFDGVIAP